MKLALVRKDSKVVREETDHPAAVALSGKVEINE